MDYLVAYIGRETFAEWVKTTHGPNGGIMLSIQIQNGVIGFILVAVLALTCFALLVKPVEVEGLGDRTILGVTIGVLVVAVVVGVLFLVDIFTISAPKESPSFVLNLLAFILFTLVALAAITWAVIIARTGSGFEWLEALSVLIMALACGYIAASLWMFADAAHMHPIGDLIARGALIATFVLIIVVALATAGYALHLWRVHVMKAGTGQQAPPTGS